ncbi:MAG: alpha-amylase family glycosyl hydrolase [Bacteroidetes bacterium]|nr:alpha-amylase family glycosyl hydrolase [Bacteroidota bacterium]
MIKLQHFFLILFATALFACTNNEDLPVPKESQSTGLAAPLMLQPDSTMIQLQDYFLDPKKIDSVRIDPSLNFAISPDSAKMVITVGQKSTPKMSVMNVWIKGYSYTILLEKSRKIWQRISFDPKEKNYKKVQVAGEMNNWNPANTYMRHKDNVWQTDLLLNPGKYQYQLVIDGKWTLDPANPDKVDNNIGGFNSLLRAGSISPSGLPWLFTDKVGESKVTIGVKNRVKDVFVLWQNYRLDNKFIKVDSSGITITIPRKTKQYESSFIRVWAVNNIGTSNEILIPLHKGDVILNPEELTRNDKEAMIIYFLMVDRFYNGDHKNDVPVIDKEVDPKVNFQGGDLSGIEQKIKHGYFSNLGINTIWISPITQNPPDAWNEYPAPHRKFSGYHGYWPITLTTVDNHFGSGEEFRNMVSEAHDKNINILLDYVSNHVHKESWLYKTHPDWATQFILKDKRKNLRLWDEQRLTTWFDEFLPTIDLTKPEIYQMISDSALFWIKQYHIDGFRHDATKHIPEIYWRTLTRKINEQVVFPENKPVFQIGETYGSRELISSYINPGELDAQFDFDLYFNARSIFAKDNGSFKELFPILQETFNYYGEHNLMGNITGNQDQSRFISFASGALTFAESDREAGWKRDIEVKDTIGYQMLAMLIAFNMTIPGIPVIYYGDEYGMPGANDPDNRRMMKFDSLNLHELKTKNMVQQLIHLRKDHLPLIYGDFKLLEVSDKAVVYMRSYFDQVVFVIMNKDKDARKIDFVVPEKFRNAKLNNHFGNNFTVKKNNINLSLKGNTFEILTN